MTDKDDVGVWLLILAGMVLFFLMVEFFFIMFFFSQGGEVECNLLWCTFTKTEERTITGISQFRDCTLNGVPVNCTMFEEGAFG